MIGTNQIPETDIKIDWNPKEGVKILGIIFYKDNLTTQAINWKKALKKVNNIMDMLQFRHLSLQGGSPEKAGYPIGVPQWGSYGVPLKYDHRVYLES